MNTLVIGYRHERLRSVASIVILELGKADEKMVN
jgi:hypothetical protein